MCVMDSERLLDQALAEQQARKAQLREQTLTRLQAEAPEIYDLLQAFDDYNKRHGPIQPSQHTRIRNIEWRSRP